MRRFESYHNSRNFFLSSLFYLGILVFMQVVIFSSKRKKSALQKILDWGSSGTSIKFQMFFTYDVSKIKYLIKHNKYDIILTTEKNLVPLLKGYKVVLVKDDFRGVGYEL